MEKRGAHEPRICKDNHEKISNRKDSRTEKRRGEEVGGIGVSLVASVTQASRGARLKVEANGG